MSQQVVLKILTLIVSTKCTAPSVHYKTVLISFNRKKLSCKLPTCILQLIISSA